MLMSQRTITVSRRFALHGSHCSQADRGVGGMRFEVVRRVVESWNVGGEVEVEVNECSAIVSIKRVV